MPTPQDYSFHCLRLIMSLCYMDVFNMSEIQQLLENANLYIRERIQEELYIFQMVGFDIQDSGLYITTYNFPSISEKVTIYLKYIDELHRNNLRNIHCYHVLLM